MTSPTGGNLALRLRRERLPPTGEDYEDSPDGDGVLVHATMPVDADPGDHDFSVVELPEIERAATIVHRGSMDGVMGTIQTLARWIDANGYRSAGYNRELYIGAGQDREAWVIELQEPLTTS